MDITYLYPHDPALPLKLKALLADQAPERITALGNLAILKEKKTAFFCSSKCPEDLSIKTQDLARKWRDDRVTVISGFHSPGEKECLTILLRGEQSIIVCPARSIETMRIKAEFRAPLAEGRLLFLSPFPMIEKRMTAKTAMKRNHFVAAMADNVFVAHAAIGGKIEALCTELAARSKPLMTFASDSNASLLELGAKPVTI
jgi:predicted Rossmann fold nucleotide-binding protein DprA/Smf involved in DNA uptake